MIKVDTREPVETIVENLTETGFYDFRVETLYHKADFVVETEDTHLGVQRKSVNDLVSSLGSLKDDLFELRTNYELSGLLIEGDWTLMGSSIGLRRGRRLVETVSAKTWHNFMLSQQLRGTFVFLTMSLTETCKALTYFDDYLNSDMNPPKSRVDDPSLLLQMLPGVGPTTAEALIEEYGSTLAALRSMSTWDQVQGIGPKTQEAAMEFVTQ